jgi:hypothetical protein
LQRLLFVPCDLVQVRARTAARRVFSAVCPPPPDRRGLSTCAGVSRDYFSSLLGAPRGNRVVRGANDTTRRCFARCRAGAPPHGRACVFLVRAPCHPTVCVFSSAQARHTFILFLCRSWPVAVVPAVKRTSMLRFVLRDGVPLFARASDPRAILCRGVTMSACHPGPCLWVKAFARAVTDRVQPPRDLE